MSQPTAPETTVIDVRPALEDEAPRALRENLSGPDRTFRIVLLSGGSLVLAIMVLIGLFLFRLES